MGIAGKILVLTGLVIIIHAGYSSEQCKYEARQIKVIFPLGLGYLYRICTVLNYSSFVNVLFWLTKSPVTLQVYIYFIFVCR